MDHVENDATNNSSIIVCVFVAVQKVSAKPLPSKHEGIYIQIHTEKLH
jgi:hypothetical protein